MYPQRDGSLAIVNIDASKGFNDLWVHFFVAIEDIHRKLYRRKWCFFLFRLNSNMFNISFSLSIFFYQNWSKSPVGTPIFDVFR